MQQARLEGLDALTERARILARASPSQRVVLGIVGGPGAGKSTLAAILHERLGASSCVVPMDGYHLSNKVLHALGRRDRKGAPDTFDSRGFAALLKRIGTEREHDVYYPVFHREMEESIAAEAVVVPAVSFVIVEGLYLLHWTELAGCFTEVWFIDVGHDERVQRLVDRRLALGYSLEEATRWSLGSDETNAQLVESTRERAQHVVTFDAQ